MNHPSFKLICLSVFLSLFCRGVESAEPETELYLETFQVVWETIRDTYYDESFNGLDWDQVYEAHYPAVEAADDMETLRMILRTMLGKLGQSHFSILPGGNSSVLPRGETLGSGTLGLEIIESGGKIYVFRVADPSPAKAAGIVPGSQIMGIDDKLMDRLADDVSVMPVPESLQSFYFTRHVQNLLSGSPGAETELLVRGLPSASSRTVSLIYARDTRRMSGTFANMPSSPVELETRELPGDIHYLRFNIFLLDIMEEIKQAILDAEGAPGLIIDLRGNPGGVGYMAAGMTGFLVTERTELGTTQMRQGHFNYIGFPQKRHFGGHLAILIDGRSASTSEILAAGLQEAGRARIFGQASAGAVLPSILTSLPNGDTLQSVIADFKTPDGVFLEGVGVQPDEAVAMEQSELLRGRDPVLNAAVQWIKSQ